MSHAAEARWPILPNHFFQVCVFSLFEPYLDDRERHAKLISLRIDRRSPSPSSRRSCPSSCFHYGDVRHRRRGAAPCQCFSLGGNQITSPGRYPRWDRPRAAPTATGCNDQRLTQRMRMPACGTRLEGDARTKKARRCRRLEQRIDADRASEIIRRSLARRLRTASFDLHDLAPPIIGQSTIVCASRLRRSRQRREPPATAITRLTRRSSVARVDHRASRAD